MFAFAALNFHSWKNNITALTYFGFMRGIFSKVIFLFYCSTLILPFTSFAHQDYVNGTINYITFGFLVFLALMQLLKYRNVKDTTHTSVLETRLEY